MNLRPSQMKSLRTPVRGFATAFAMRRYIALLRSLTQLEAQLEMRIDTGVTTCVAIRKLWTRIMARDVDAFVVALPPACAHLRSFEFHEFREITAEIVRLSCLKKRGKVRISSN